MILLDSRDQIFSYLYDPVNKKKAREIYQIKMQHACGFFRTKSDGIHSILIRKNFNKNHQQHFRNIKKNNKSPFVKVQRTQVPFLFY